MPQYVELNPPESKETESDTSSLTRWPVWATGFRPFFFGGAVMAALSIAAWLIVFFGGLGAGGPAGPIDWHAHEMIFGFTPAIIAGFLLTAVPKWTGVETPTGGGLIALFGLWVAGRLAMAGAGLVPYLLVAIVDLLFLPALAVAIAIPIGRSWTARNLGFIPLLFGLAAANTLFHLDVLGLVDGLASTGLDAGLGIIIVIIAVVGGRVIPFFTSSALGVDTGGRRRLVDIVALGMSVAWLVALIIDPTAMATGALALAAGAANLGRMWGWKTPKVFSIPLLWVLHVGYAFVGIGLLLFGLDVFDVTGTRSIAVHALTTGAIGILCLGMMARVSLGHTGRPLKAHRWTAVAFVAIAAAAIVRVFVPWLVPGGYEAAVVGSGILWTGAWILFLVVYAKILVRPRADGRPG